MAEQRNSASLKPTLGQRPRLSAHVATNGVSFAAPTLQAKRQAVASYREFAKPLSASGLPPYAAGANSA